MYEYIVVIYDKWYDRSIFQYTNLKDVYKRQPSTSSNTTNGPLISFNPMCWIAIGPHSNPCLLYTSKSWGVSVGKDKIIIKGAREHNLKNVDVTIPRDKLVVFTGLSGSGKSSLAFDTIYADGQRRYVESLSSYARQFLGQMEKPDVDEIEGLSLIHIYIYKFSLLIHNQ